MADSQPTSPRGGELGDSKLPPAHKRCKNCREVITLATQVR